MRFLILYLLVAAWASPLPQRSSSIPQRSNTVPENEPVIWQPNLLGRPTPPSENADGIVKRELWGPHFPSLPDVMLGYEDSIFCHFTPLGAFIDTVGDLVDDLFFPDADKPSPGKLECWSDELWREHGHWCQEEGPNFPKITDDPVVEDPPAPSPDPAPAPEPTPVPEPTPIPSSTLTTSTLEPLHTETPVSTVKVAFNYDTGLIDFTPPTGSPQDWSTADMMSFYTHVCIVDTQVTKTFAPKLDQAGLDLCFDVENSLYADADAAMAAALGEDDPTLYRGPGDRYGYAPRKPSMPEDLDDPRPYLSSASLARFAAEGHNPAEVKQAVDWVMRQIYMNAFLAGAPGPLSSHLTRRKASSTNMHGASHLEPKMKMARNPAWANEGGNVSPDKTTTGTAAILDHGRNGEWNGLSSGVLPPPQAAVSSPLQVSVDFPHMAATGGEGAGEFDTNDEILPTSVADLGKRTGDTSSVSDSKLDSSGPGSNSISDSGSTKGSVSDIPTDSMTGALRDGYQPPDVGATDHVYDGPKDGMTGALPDGYQPPEVDGTDHVYDAPTDSMSDQKSEVSNEYHDYDFGTDTMSDLAPEVGETSDPVPDVVTDDTTGALPDGGQAPEVGEVPGPVPDVLTDSATGALPDGDQAPEVGETSGPVPDVLTDSTAAALPVPDVLTEGTTGSADPVPDVLTESTTGSTDPVPDVLPDNSIGALPDSTTGALPDGDQLLEAGEPSDPAHDVPPTAPNMLETPAANLARQGRKFRRMTYRIHKLINEIKLAGYMSEKQAAECVALGLAETPENMELLGIPYTPVTAAIQGMKIFAELPFIPIFDLPQGYMWRSDEPQDFGDHWQYFMKFAARMGRDPRLYALKQPPPKHWVPPAHLQPPKGGKNPMPKLGDVLVVNQVIGLAERPEFITALIAYAGLEGTLITPEIYTKVAIYGRLWANTHGFSIRYMTSSVLKSLIPHFHKMVKRCMTSHKMWGLGGVLAAGVGSWAIIAGAKAFYDMHRESEGEPVREWQKPINDGDWPWLTDIIVQTKTVSGTKVTETITTSSQFTLPTVFRETMLNPWYTESPDLKLSATAPGQPTDTPSIPDTLAPAGWYIVNPAMVVADQTTDLGETSQPTHPGGTPSYEQPQETGSPDPTSATPVRTSSSMITEAPRFSNQTVAGNGTRIGYSKIDSGFSTSYIAPKQPDLPDTETEATPNVLDEMKSAVLPRGIINIYGLTGFQGNPADEPPPPEIASPPVIFALSTYQLIPTGKYEKPWDLIHQIFFNLGHKHAASHRNASLKHGNDSHPVQASDSTRNSNVSKWENVIWLNGSSTGAANLNVTLPSTIPGINMTGTSLLEPSDDSTRNSNVSQWKDVIWFNRSSTGAADLNVTQPSTIPGVNMTGTSLLEPSTDDSTRNSNVSQWKDVIWLNSSSTGVADANVTQPSTVPGNNMIETSVLEPSTDDSTRSHNASRWKDVFWRNTSSSGAATLNLSQPSTATGVNVTGTSVLEPSTEDSTRSHNASQWKDVFWRNASSSGAATLNLSPPSTAPGINVTGTGPSDGISSSTQNESTSQWMDIPWRNTSSTGTADLTSTQPSTVPGTNGTETRHLEPLVDDSTRSPNNSLLKDAFWRNGSSAGATALDVSPPSTTPEVYVTGTGLVEVTMSTSTRNSNPSHWKAVVWRNSSSTGVGMNATRVTTRLGRTGVP